MRPFLRAAIVTFSVVSLSLSIPARTLADEDEAASPISGSNANVQVTIRVVETVEGETVPVKTYQLVTHGDGEPTSLMTGSRIPIPVTTFKAADPPDRPVVPMTSYSYQNVGFSALIRARIVTDNVILLDGKIEDSRLAGTWREDGQPTIHTSQQDISAMLLVDAPLRIAMVDEIDAQSVYYEVEVKVLDEATMVARQAEVSLGTTAALRP